jgi:hypothetical protein
MGRSSGADKEIIATASAAIFGNPLVTNVYRSVIVEAIVAAALPDLQWVGAEVWACLSARAQYQDPDCSEDVPPVGRRTEREPNTPRGSLKNPRIAVVLCLTSPNTHLTMTQCR